MHGDDPFDLGRLRVTDEMAQEIADYRGKRLKPKANGTDKRPKTFVRFPIEEYARIAATGRYDALVLYGWLLHLSWKGVVERAPIKLTNKATAGLALDRFAKKRALHKLEEMGLIRVERQARKSPRVIVL